MAKVYTPSEIRYIKVGLQIQNTVMNYYVTRVYGTGIATNVSQAYAKKCIMDGIVAEIGASDAWIIQYFGQDALDAQNSGTPTPTPVPTPVPTPTPAPTPETYILKLKSTIPMSNKVAAIAQKLSFVSAYGWQMGQIKLINPNELDIELIKTGSVTIVLVCSIIIGVLFVLLGWISYSIVKKVSDNSIIKENFEAKQSCLDAYTNGKITKEEYDACIATIPEIPDPTPSPDPWTEIKGLIPMVIIVMLIGAMKK